MSGSPPDPKVSAVPSLRFHALLSLLGLALIAGCCEAPRASGGPQGTSPIIVEVREVRPQAFRETIFTTGTFLATR